MPLTRTLQYLWASPNSTLGLMLALLGVCTGGKLKRHRGIIEAHGGLVTWWLKNLVPLHGGAMAFTLGHVVLGQNPEALHATRAHERVHVRQYERWGPLFLPAYAVASLIAWKNGRCPYRDNAFEREAYAVD